MQQRNSKTDSRRSKTEEVDGVEYVYEGQHRAKHRGRVQGSGERKGDGESQYCRGWAARMLQSTGSRVRTQWPPTGDGHEHEPRAQGWCREERRCSRRAVLVVVIVSSARSWRVVVALPSAFAVTHTEGGYRRKTNASRDACEERRICRWPSELRVHEHDDNNPP